MQAAALTLTNMVISPGVSSVVMGLNACSMSFLPSRLTFSLTHMPAGRPSSCSL